jgi:hypothetical protein
MPMYLIVEHELTIEQAWEIALLRWRHPAAEVVVHPKPWGCIVEVRRGRRAVELLRCGMRGEIARDERIPRAA